MPVVVDPGFPRFPRATNPSRDANLLSENCMKIRMHSSRMRTFRNSSRHLGEGGYLVPGVVPGPGGCTWSGGCTWCRGVYLVLGGCTWSREGTCPGTPPPRGQTDTCKNITFVTSLRTVIKELDPRLDVLGTTDQSFFNFMV